MSNYTTASPQPPETNLPLFLLSYDQPSTLSSGRQLFIPQREKGRRPPAGEKRWGRHSTQHGPQLSAAARTYHRRIIMHHPRMARGIGKRPATPAISYR